MENERLPKYETPGCPFCSCPRKECEETEDYVTDELGICYVVCRCTWDDHKWLSRALAMPFAGE